MTLELDKRIPIAFLVTIALQTGGLAFWLGQLSTRIDQLERQVVRSQEQRDKLIAMEVQLQNIKTLLERLDK